MTIEVEKISKKKMKRQRAAEQEEAPVGKVETTACNENNTAELLAPAKKKKKKSKKTESTAEADELPFCSAPSPSSEDTTTTSPADGAEAESSLNTVKESTSEDKPEKKKKKKKSKGEKENNAEVEVAISHQAVATTSCANKIDPATLEKAKQFRAKHQIRVTKFQLFATEQQEKKPSAEQQPAQLIEAFPPSEHFEESLFGPEVHKELLAGGFTTPTPIQAQVWPIAKEGHDLVAVAKTGSGKTLAFLLPCFEKILQSSSKTDSSIGNGPKLLVLAPTRELATQIDKDARRFLGKFATGTKATEDRTRSATACCLIYGGVPKFPQQKQLKESKNLLVLTATPGRLCDHMKDGSVKLSSVACLAIDEADRMLEMGFEPQMKEIVKELPKSSDRQTLLFSATWPKAMKKLLLQNDYLVREEEKQNVEGSCSSVKKVTYQINVGETDDLAANKAVKQEFYELSDDVKDGKLWKLLDQLKDSDKTIVFANTKRRVQKLSQDVWASGYQCSVLSGDQTQQDRDKSLKEFKENKTKLLFGTDVCARGLDIKDVTHVINYDMARDVESYIHRIGRTGRAGNNGTSITFVNSDYDMQCSPALVKIAKEAGQEVPEWLEKLAKKSATSGKKVDKLWKY
ncbi:unnamed protein product [Amoebophrya sp. A120]|nr:unnamed protein product [Amoebophrya sp. A120]|eukprot:GSA120T00021883001.1